VFIDSGFAPPVPAFPFPVALVNSDPDENPLVTICFNRDWLPYVVTCLYQLTLQATWATNDADALNLVQARAMTLISNFIQGCNPPLPNAVPGADGGDEFMLRQNPDNPCELQTSVDGVHWCTWADLSLCKPDVTQPGGGSEQPPAGGGQACYNAVMRASEQWNVPTSVSSGDQITFSNVKGAGADGGIDGLWYCPNGQTFVAGLCIGVPGPKTADIANTIPHMRLIVKVGATWYDAYDTSFTVPGGVTGSPVIVQINDSTISDNSGSYTFDVCVTNNQSANFTHTFDFTANDGGFVQWDAVNDKTDWTPGVGWVTHDPATQPYAVIKRTLSGSRTITAMQMTFTKNDPYTADPSFEFCTMQVGSTTVFNDYTQAAGTGTVVVNSTSSAAGARLAMRLCASIISAGVLMSAFSMGAVLRCVKAWAEHR